MQFGPGLVPTFLYYFASTAIVFTLVISKATGLDLDTGIPHQVGAIGGLVAGSLGAYFNRSLTLSVPFQSPKKFLTHLEQVLNQSGYQFSSEEDGIRTYERIQFSKWFSGKVYVLLEDKSATIASRASIIRRLRQQLE